MLELAQLLLDIVVPRKTCRALEQIDDRVKRRTSVVRRALQALYDGGTFPDGVPGRLKQTALTDPRLALEQHHLAVQEAETGEV